MERAIIFTLRLLNSAASFAARPSSVVHTGVKSRGWENRMPHLEGEGRSWCEGEDVSQDLLGFGYLEMMFSVNLRACSLSVCDNRSFVLDVVPGIMKPGVLSLE